MLKVEITLCPFGSDADARVLHTVYIGNMSKRGEDPPTYHAWVDEDPRWPGNKAILKMPHAVVKDHYRADGSLALTGRILNALGDLRNWKLSRRNFANEHDESSR